MKSSRSKAFVATRKQHEMETAEDYTELILDLIEAKGEARIKDIAEAFGISHVTALRTVARLERDGFVITAPHEPVFLTRKGKGVAQASKRRHQILLEFLVGLGVPKEVAEIDVEGIEHHISEITLRVIEKRL